MPFFLLCRGGFWTATSCPDGKVVSLNVKTLATLKAAPNQRLSEKGTSAIGKEKRLKKKAVTTRHALSRTVTTEKRRGD
jgi:hypothetical protein